MVLGWDQSIHGFQYVDTQVDKQIDNIGRQIDRYRHRCKCDCVYDFVHMCIVCVCVP